MSGPADAENDFGGAAHPALRATFSRWEKGTPSPCSWGRGPAKYRSSTRS